MDKRVIDPLILFAVSLFLNALPLTAQDAADKIAQESAAKAKATASEKVTPEQVIAKVNEATAILKKEGKAALDQFRGKDSPFIFGGTYISIHKIDGKVLLNPIKPKMEGKNMIALRDADGKAIFVEMNNLAQKGGGWIEYLWPEPGSPLPVKKVTYVKLAKIGGDDAVIKCGIYGLTDAEIEKLTRK